MGRLTTLNNHFPGERNKALIAAGLKKAPEQEQSDVAR
jgi:hypothetical protein